MSVRTGVDAGDGGAHNFSVSIEGFAREAHSELCVSAVREEGYCDFVSIFQVLSRAFRASFLVQSSHPTGSIFQASIALPRRTEMRRVLAHSLSHAISLSDNGRHECDLRRRVQVFEVQSTAAWPIHCDWRRSLADLHTCLEPNPWRRVFVSIPAQALRRCLIFCPLLSCNDQPHLHVSLSWQRVSCALQSVVAPTRIFWQPHRRLSGSVSPIYCC